MSKQKRRPILQNPNLQGVLVITIVVVIAGIFFLSNRQPQQVVARPVPLVTNTAVSLEEWQVALEQEFDELPTPTATQEVTNTPFVPPTLPPRPTTSSIVFQPDTLQTSPFPTLTAFPTQPLRLTPSPSFIDSTPVPTPEGIGDLQVAEAVEPNTERFQLPPEEVPLSAHPFDHYYLTRPIDVTANSQSLFYYPYGSGGNRGWRIHRGIDIPNPVGQEVRAAGDGIVVCADRTTTDNPESDCDTEVFASYGNMVVIQHNFGWRGLPVWTLYAHLSAITVTEGERVKTGDIIGLVGATGQVTGPHVHFEVRVANDRYASTRNPILWMAPYIGHGVVAGRVIDGEGRYIENALVQLNRGGRVTDSTLTYVDAYVEGARDWTVIPDENWQENFAMGDIPAGEYQLVVVVDDERIFQNITVNAGTTSFVQIQFGAVSTPQPFLEATAILPTAIPTNLPTATP